MTIRRHGCYNRPPPLDTITVQDGWSKYGHRITKEMPHVLSRECRHDLRHSDPGCKGCKHVEHFS